MIFTPVLSSLLVTANALEHYARTVPAVVDRVRAAQVRADACDRFVPCAAPVLTETDADGALASLRAREETRSARVREAVRERLRGAARMAGLTIPAGSEDEALLEAAMSDDAALADLRARLRSGDALPRLLGERIDAARQRVRDTLAAVEPRE